MRYFCVAALLAALSLAGCTPKLFRASGMRPVASVSMSRGSLFPVFDSMDAPWYYSAQIDFKDKSMGGILAMTQESAGQFRLVMMTTFGVSLFDFSLSADSFVVNSCMEQLNKKSVLGILEKDFRALLMLNVPEKCKAVFYQRADKKDWSGYAIKTSYGECDYIVYPREGGFVRQVQNGCAIKRMSAMFDEQVVTLSHPRLGLKMLLTRMGE